VELHMMVMGLHLLQVFWLSLLPTARGRLWLLLRVVGKLEASGRWGRILGVALDACCIELQVRTEYNMRMDVGNLDRILPAAND
jgi:hypothetical protein